MAAYSGEGKLRVGTTRGRFGVLLEITDDGPGIESSNLERVFDPFWTTKAPGEGTGLGLSLVHNIVAEHGGVVDLHSEVGVGTTFYVDFPAAEPTTAAGPELPEVASSFIALRILVVDDEAAVRRSLVRYLEREGHQVDEASEGGEALRKVNANSDYDVILSDLRMPGIDGEQLLLRLKEQGRGDERKVLFMTGDATGVDLRVVGASSPLLIKPIKLEDVGDAVRKRASDLAIAERQKSLVA
jgi:CheY-like chemotaxis protein